MSVESPSAVSAEPVWKTLHPTAVVVGQRIGLVFTATAALVSLVGAAIAFAADAPPNWVKALIVFFWFAGVALTAWLSWTVPIRRFRHTRYRVDRLGLLVHRGRIFHSERGVARSRIQHSDVTQGPIQRAFGIATLTIYTAGTEDAQLTISGIAFDEARSLRAELTGQSSDDVV